MSPERVWRTFNEAGLGIDDALKAVLAERRDKSTRRMYDMLGYFFGFLDTNLKRAKSRGGGRGQAGKRFRPALCLSLAEGYGAREKAQDAALAIELFHNFTLIHDDVEDKDEYRRNRPTLWKLFGVEHAINAGDALSLMACEVAGNTEPRVRKILMAAFAEVIEGQYMDFQLASMQIGSRAASVAAYMASTRMKTGALVGAAAEVAGMCARQSAAECARLKKYGRSLGTAFQLADDYASVWSTYGETDKDAQSDIRERKRTLPFLVGYEETPAKRRLAKLYNVDRQLSRSEIDEALTIINTTSARSHVLREISAHAERARATAEGLSLPKTTRGLLSEFVDLLASPLQKP